MCSKSLRKLISWRPLITLGVLLQISLCLAQSSTDISIVSLISSSSSSLSSSSSSSSSQKQDKRSSNLGTITLAEALQEQAIKNSANKIYSKSASASAEQINETREALSQESSERDAIVYVSDTSGYIPVTALRGRPVHPPPDPYGGVTDVDAWRPQQETWDRDYRRYRHNTTRVQHIEAECQDDYMKIRIGFNGSFAGLLYSSGYASDPDCMYINGTGRDYYEFYIQLNRCGTLGKNTHHEDNRRNPTKNFMWNTVTVQYNPLIEEEFDEHFKVTCEYGYDFWKTVTFPFLDVEVATGNPVVFTLTPPECYMEIRNGYGTTGTRVSGPVRVGDPLTLIIYMRSKYDGFDLVVNDCYAHNGANKKIQLIDEYGCPVDDKLISRFRGSWSDSGVFETQVFAYMKTFRFTGSPALYIECDVRMCHGRCPTQPCHWRNNKGVQKRSLQDATSGSSTLPSTASEAPSLSDNISLFQALRVLQEGEADEDLDETTKQSFQDLNQTCIKTTVLTTMLASSCIILCALTGALLVACTKLRRRHDDDFFDTCSYVTHKGQID